MKGILSHIMLNGVRGLDDSPHIANAISVALSQSPLIDCSPVLCMEAAPSEQDEDIRERPRYHISIPARHFCLLYERHIAICNVHAGLEAGYNYMSYIFGKQEASRWADLYVIAGGESLISLVVLRQDSLGSVHLMSGESSVSVWGGGLVVEPDLAMDGGEGDSILLASIKSLAILNGRSRMSPRSIPMKARERRRASKRWGCDPLNWKSYTIEIAIPKSRGGGWTPLSSAARTPHLVRGNYATYSADKPLFGKRVGTFYRPPHIRA